LSTPAATAEDLCRIPLTNDTFVRLPQQRDACCQIRRLPCGCEAIADALLSAAFPERGTEVSAVARRFEAAVLDWDVFEPDVLDDARSALEQLLSDGFELCVITAADIGDVAGRLHVLPVGPGSLIYCANQGSEVYAAG